MEIQQKPDYLIFAEGSKSGELSDFPDISRGWGITLEQTQAKPPLEWMNSAFNRIDKNTLYLLQQGVPEWSESVLYPIGAIIKVGGTLYEAKTQNTNLNPANSLNDWQLVVRFQDATTKQKGIVQLNSSTDSESETQAATSLAVKKAYDAGKNAQTSSIGYNQTWQNVTSEREGDIEYINTTGRPIFVQVNKFGYSDTAGEIIVDGVSTGRVTGNDMTASCYAIVPNLSKYLYTLSNISYWSELR